MKVKDITDVIEEFAPLSIQEGWDNSGLCIGSPQSEVHSVLLGFDCTEALVDEAIQCEADMIVTHHPLLFNGLKKISADDPVGAAVIKAVSAGISVYAAHTTADKVIAGVSGSMARTLGLEDVSILDEDGIICPKGDVGHESDRKGVGLGVVGNFPHPMSSEEAVRFVKERFHLKAMRTSRPLDIPISRVAMCGGAGSSLIGKAMESGAQLYLCGDVSYHHFFTPKDFMIMDIGHYESEVEIVDVLFSVLKKKFPNFAVRISVNLHNSNPIYYF